MPSAEDILDKFNAIKTLPHVAIRLSKLVADENCTIQELQEVIRMDPTLVLRLLRLVNSPYYGLREKADTIAKAVVYLGMKNLRNMVIVEALKAIFKKDDRNERFSMLHLWLHCAAVSICGQMIAERIFAQKGEDAFLCGILHDVGMIVENQVVPDTFRDACSVSVESGKELVKCEKSAIGTDHCRVGYCLARGWNLPGSVQSGIRNHHKMREDISPSSITGIMQIAEYLVERMGYSAIPGLKTGLSSCLLLHIRDNLNEYKTLVRDLPDEMSKARDLYDFQEL